MKSCARCHVPSTLRCSRCSAVYYCSSACQRKDWNLGHSVQCTKGGLVTTTEESRDALVKKIAPVAYLYPPSRIISMAQTAPLQHNPGLENKNNSCYLNAVLQAVLHVPSFMGYLRADDVHCSHEDDSFCMRCVLRDLASSLKSSQSPVFPRHILRHLSLIQDSLVSGRQEDAHEFFRAMVHALAQSELERGQRFAEYSLDTHTLSTLAVAQVFEGLFRSQIKCKSCGAVSNTYESFQDLSLEVSDNTDSLRDALDSFTAPETLRRDNMFRCDGCKELVEGTKKLCIQRCPPILAVHLKRFRLGFRGKINKKIPFPLDLGMQPYLTGAQQGDAKYRLSGFVVHLDKFNMSFFGHYIAFVRDQHNTWWCYDDETVTKVSREEAFQHNAYLLLYQRVSAMDPPIPASGSLDDLHTSQQANRNGPQQCLNGCGFFGSKDLDGLCSVCHHKENPDSVRPKRPMPSKPAHHRPTPPDTTIPMDRLIGATQSASLQPKLGRNQPCYCSSGLKFKKCHGRS